MILFVFSYYMLINRNTLRLIVQNQYVLISQKSCVPVTEPLQYVLLLLLLYTKDVNQGQTFILCRIFTKICFIYVNVKFQCIKRTDKYGSLVVFTPQKFTLYNCRQTFPVHLKSTERKIHNLSIMLRGENLHLAF